MWLKMRQRARLLGQRWTPPKPETPSSASYCSLRADPSYLDFALTPRAKSIISPACRHIYLLLRPRSHTVPDPPATC